MVNEKSWFLAALREAGLTKKQLANNLGRSYVAVCKWGDSPPRYAIEYLRLYLTCRALRAAARLKGASPADLYYLED